MNLLPAIPPEDYTGSIKDWIIALEVRGLLSEDQDYNSVKISESLYNEILNECEKE